MKAIRRPFSLAALFLALVDLPSPLIAGTSPGPVEFSAAGYSVSETGVTAVIALHRIQVDGDPFTVSYSAFDGDARTGEDYVAGSGTVSFAAFQTNATFAISISDDQRFEGIETVNLILHDPTGGATLGTRSNAVLTIVDDESMAPGLLDESFDPGTGVRGVVRSIATEPNGRILIAGEFDNVGGTRHEALARLNANGSVDAGFQPRLVMGDRVNAVVRTEAGKIVIGGSFTTVGMTSRCRIARLHEDGSVDTTFDPGTGANQEVSAVCVQPDQRVVIGGGFEAVQGVYRKGLARLNADGTLDTRFVPPVPDGAVRSLRLQNDGAILVGGSFTTMDGVPRTFVARLNPDGSLDPSFNPGAGNPVHDGTGVYTVEIQADGGVIVGGDFTILFGRGRAAVMRLHADGLLDDSFAPNVPVGGKVWSVAVQSDGRILMGGTFERLANPSCCALFERGGIARLNPDGSVDTSFDPGAGAAPQSVNVVALQRDSKVLMGGSFTDIDGRPRRSVARLIGDMLPRIQTMEVRPDKQVELTIIAQAARSCVIEVSTDTVTWNPLATNVSETALLNFVDKTAPGTVLRFYRVRQLGQ